MANTDVTLDNARKDVLSNQERAKKFVLKMLKHFEKTCFLLKIILIPLLSLRPSLLSPLRVGVRKVR